MGLVAPMYIMAIPCHAIVSAIIRHNVAGFS